MLLGLIDLNMLGAAQLPANSTIHYSLEGGEGPRPISFCIPALEVLGRTRTTRLLPMQEYRKLLHSLSTKLLHT